MELQGRGASLDPVAVVVAEVATIVVQLQALSRSNLLGNQCPSIEDSDTMLKEEIRQQSSRIHCKHFSGRNQFSISDKN